MALGTHERITAIVEDRALLELDLELDAQILTDRSLQMGISDALGNDGKYCTLSVECMPTCS